MALHLEWLTEFCHLSKSTCKGRCGPCATRHPQDTQSITIAIDVMFINKVPFLITISCNLHFRMVEALPNRQVPTILDKLNGVVHLYRHHGLNVLTILADPEFKPICEKFPCLNCCGTNEHVPKIEQYIHTNRKISMIFHLVSCCSCVNKP